MLDVIGLKKKRFGLGFGGDKFHRRRFGNHAGDATRMPHTTGIIRHTLFEALGFTNIQHRAFAIDHAINTRRIRQRLQRGLNNFHTVFQPLGSRLSFEAEIKVAASIHAQHNPNALLPYAVTIEDVINSPMVADPLHRLDCCVVTDGGGALVIVSPEVARSLGRTNAKILGHGEAIKHTDNGRIDLTYTGAVWSGPRAFAEAGVSVKDIDYASIYDSFTITVLQTIEDLGFCDKGKGGDKEHKEVICHIPPGNPENAHTIEVDEHAVKAHLDHGDTPETCFDAIELGFTSVMMDGSLKEDGKTPADFDYNAKVTKAVVDLAHRQGVSVEGELGCLGSLESGKAGEEDGHGAEGHLSHDQLLTDPDQAADFVAKTGVDALAIAIGMASVAAPLTTAVLASVDERHTGAYRARLGAHRVEPVGLVERRAVDGLDALGGEHPPASSSSTGGAR